MEKAILRVLIVDDFQPWRQFLLATLQKLPRFRVIGEESDGVSAVHRAEELRPDLIILDISIPELNGIEAARRIRKLSPDSKILFASADRSWETVEVALETGAAGYVVKTDAGKELVPAIEAVVQGKQFVSPSVAGSHDAHPAKQQNQDRVEQDAVPSFKDRKVRHEVEFYPDDSALVSGFTRAIGAALEVGSAAIVIATASHHSQIFERSINDGVDLNAAIEKGSYVTVQAAHALEIIMSDGMPDADLCSRLVGDIIARTGKAGTANGTRVAICGEGPRILLEEGKEGAAIRLERVWDEITKQYGADTFCGYLWSAFPEGEDSALFRRICDEHSAVHGRASDQGIN